MPVCLTPILALVISAPERVRIIEIMHRGNDFVETVLRQVLRNLLPLTLLHAYLNAFEHFEAFRNHDIPVFRFAAVQYSPGMHKGIDPVNFLIPRVDVENFRDVILVVRLHRRNEEIAMVGEAEAAQPLSDGLCRSRLHCRAFPVERELTMIMIVEKHQLKPSMCPSTTSILNA